jgi:hypothetical protein
MIRLFLVFALSAALWVNPVARARGRCALHNGSGSTRFEEHNSDRGGENLTISVSQYHEWSPGAAMIVYKGDTRAAVRKSI